RPRPLENRQPLRARHHQRVPVGDEQLLSPFRRRVEIFEAFLERPHAKALVAIHVAVGAVIPAATDRRLQDVGVGLGRRPVHHAVVPRGPPAGGGASAWPSARILSPPRPSNRSASVRPRPSASQAAPPIRSRRTSLPSGRPMSPSSTTVP